MKDRYDMMSPSSSISSSPETLLSSSHHRQMTPNYLFSLYNNLLRVPSIAPPPPPPPTNAAGFILNPSFYPNLYSSAAGPASMPAFPPVNMLSRTVATPSESDATSSEEHLRPPSLGHNYYGHRYNPYMLPRHSTDPKPSSL